MESNATATTQEAALTALISKWGNKITGTKEQSVLGAVALVMEETDASIQMSREAVKAKVEMFNKTGIVKSGRVIEKNIARQHISAGMQIHVDSLRDMGNSAPKTSAVLCSLWDVAASVKHLK